MSTRDMVVIGASAGGLEALLEMVAVLPVDLPASVFVAQHLEPGVRSRLAEILSARGKLPATFALHGEPIRPSHIYVAPPDNHLIVRPGYLQVVRGPKENGHRPSVDVLFRSAAAVYGPRVTAVVLSGYRDCGTSGVLSIRARGGAVLVQDPDLAAARDMPESVLRHVAADHVGSPREIAQWLLAHAASQASSAARPPAVVAELEGEKPGAPSAIVCPLCNGTLTEVDLAGHQSFRCHVGHAFSLSALAIEQAESLERALWAAVRALQESAGLAGRLAQTSSAELRQRFEEKERSQRQAADVLVQLLLGQGTLTAPDAPSAEHAPTD